MIKQLKITNSEQDKKIVTIPVKKVVGDLSRLGEVKFKKVEFCSSNKVTNHLDKVGA